MDIFHAIILGVIEGVTEFLPVSSTGHMIIASHVMQIPQTEFLKTFEIAIQLGAICAVAGLYWRTFLLDWEVVIKVATAFIPTAVIGFVLYKLIKHYLMGNAWIVIASLFLGGILIILFEKSYKPKEKDVKDVSKISYSQALMIGVFQSLAVVPGVSRSAATILGGLMLGVSRKAIVEFSFLLAVPTMAAATVLDILKADGDITSGEWGILGVGFFIALIVAWFSVKFLLRYITRHDFTVFGIYRILAAIVFAFLIYRN